MMENPAHPRSAIPTVPPARIFKLALSALGATAAIGITAEAIQAAAEFSRLVVDPVFFGVGVPRGDGRPVMVIPGFLADDRYLNTLRTWLRRIGYAPLVSGLKRNTGFRQELLAQLEQRAHAASDQTGRSISIIGHSLGGIYARAIARRNPAIVRDIITMGSPLRLDAAPTQVPFAAIYTRNDRIVRYPRAVADDPNARNVEAGGCHVGMAFNADVYRVISEALASTYEASTSSQESA
jgi:triacylglycerol lipase